MKTTLCTLLGFICLVTATYAQNGSDVVLKEADELFDKGEFAEAMPLYSQLVSLDPGDHVLNYKLGTCVIHSGENQESAIGFLEYAVKGSETPKEGWFYLGKARQLAYYFKDALTAYDRFKNEGDKKELAKHKVEEAIKQCQNGLKLLSNIKDVRVLNKLEVEEKDFFRFYDLENIGGKIVITPDELKSAYDKKKGLQSLVYLPDNGGPIYFASYGKDGSTGTDIYRSELRPDGVFMTPVKLPSNVNSDADEDHAFMHPDGNTFYFSSKGHSSMGGFDIFKCDVDPVRDFWGEAQNMDFAVNTPDDDIMYLIDPSGEEACFASGRQSAQGSIHVYRVQTNQVPLALTILKGEFTSEIDGVDNDAKIVVEDGISHQEIGQYNTAQDGSYVISLPRSGKYKFIVTSNSSGNTHMGMVEIPSTGKSNAFRQELILVMNEGNERLIIKNYFEEPLDEDLLSLAQEEIKRRALLDVNGASEEEGPIAQVDPLREAGFGPDVTMEDALSLAQVETNDLGKEVEKLTLIKEQSYGISEEQSLAAQNFKKEAEKLLEEGAGDDEALIQEAAILQLRSKRANERARAAERLGVILDQEYADKQEQEKEFATLSSRLTAAQNIGDEEQVLEILKKLKNTVDNRTDDSRSSVDLAERLRRSAKEEERIAARKLDRVLESSEEENRLMMRIDRLKREQERLKGNKLKDNQEEVHRLSLELEDVKADKNVSLSKAENAEKDASTARTQVDLLELLISGRTIDAPTITEERKKELPQEIALVEKELEELPIEQRYQDEAKISLSDLADTESAVNTTLADSFEVPDASISGTGTTETMAVEQASTVSTETLQEEAIQSESTEVLADEQNAITETRTADLGNSNTESVRGMETAGSASTETEIATNGVSEFTETEIADQQGIEGIDASDELTRAMDPSETNTVSENEGDLAGLTETDQSIVDTDLEATQAATTTSAVYESVLPGFNPQMEDEDLEKVLGLYIFDTNAETADSQTEILARKRKVQMIDQNIAQQKEALQDDPVDRIQREEVLARLENLKEAHQENIDELENAGERNELVLQPVDESDATVAAVPTAQSTMNVSSAIERDYIAIESEPTRVFESQTQFRSNKTGEAGQIFTQEIAQLRGLNAQLDSLERLKLDAPDDTQYDELTREADKKTDDILIQRTDLGMRSEYITKQERKYLLDSLNVSASAAKSVKGAASADAIARSFEETAEAEFDNAKRIRKEADRTMDIVEKDQLYRQAYDEELSALQNIGKAITVYQYKASEYFVADENVSFRQMEEALFGPIQPQEEVIASTGERSPEASNVTGSVTINSYDDIPLENINDEIALQHTIANSKTEESDRLFAEAQTLYAKAQMLEDSAAVVKKKKVREELEEEVRLLRKRADRSMEMAEDARSDADAAWSNMSTLEEKQRSAINVKKFYMLENDDLYLIENDADYSAYFEAKANAMALIEEAFQAESQAEANRVLADMYLNEVNSILLGDDSDTGLPSEERKQRASQLNAQALVLYQQADSLDNVASALRSKASLQEQLAQGVLESVGETKASEILATEQRVRRSLADPEPMAVNIEEVDEGPLPVLAPGSIYNDPDAEAEARKAAQEAIDKVLAQANELENDNRVTSEDNDVVNEELPVQNEELQQEEPLALVEDPVIQEQATEQFEAPITQPQATENFEEEDVLTTTETAVEASSVSTEEVNTNASGMLMADVFYITEEGSAVESIQYNPTLPNGVVYKVQVGAFSKRVPDDLYGTIGPVMGEELDNGIIRYSAGMFIQYSTAQEARDQVRAKGYEDAFVVAYINGEKKSIREAEAQMAIDRPELVSAPVVSQPRETSNTSEPVVASIEELDSKYDMSALDTDYGNTANAAPAKKVETIKGLFFTVQVGVYSKPVSVDRLFNVEPLNTELLENGTIRYTTGRHTSIANASSAKDNARARGINDAFVTAYMNGTRVSLTEAKSLLSTHGDAVLAP